MRGNKILKVVLWAAVLLAAYALLIAATGGFTFRLAGVRVRSHSWLRPAAAAAVLAAISGVVARRAVARWLAAAWTVLDSRRAARVLAMAAAAWTLFAGVKFGTFVAGGSDSYGYVSQAMLLADGRLTDTIPADPAFRWPDVRATLTPLAFVPGTTSDSIAPSYAPGLPLLMAATAWVSADALYFVVPVLGMVAVWLCYRVGASCGDPLAGSIAAALLAVSPTFVFQLVQPMSDVPATACWLAALFLASRGTTAASLASGAAVSIAILIRANLAPLAAVVIALAAFAGSRGARLRRASFVLAGILPGLAALGWIQHARYGSALVSGYGDAGSFLSFSSVGPNMDRYPRWLTETHTWFIWMWILAPFAALRDRTSRTIGWSAIAVIVGVLAAYLPYSYFQRHEWQYTRFILPAIPFMLLLGTMVALAWVRRAPLVLRLPLIALVVAGLGISFVRAAAERDAFHLHAVERKYKTAGEYVARQLPPNAFVLAAQHSGSVRQYGHRPILRWDLLDARALDEAVGALRSAGRVPFLVVDGFEYEEFRVKFSAASQKSAERARLVTLVDDVRVYAFE